MSASKQIITKEDSATNEPPPRYSTYTSGFERVPNPIKTAVEKSRNSVRFKIVNNTGFDLTANPNIYAHWGNSYGTPKNCPAGQSVDAGAIISSHAPFTGSAGMVRYSLTGAMHTKYITLAATNPYLSPGSRRTMGLVDDCDTWYPKSEWGKISENSGQRYHPWAEFELKIISFIDRDEAATATFYFKCE